MNLFINLYALLGTVPFLVFPLVGLAAYAVVNDKKIAIRFAMDVTTFILIGSVSALYDHLFGTEIKGFWILLFILLVLTGLLGNAQNRMRGKVNPQKLLRAIWRIGFLVLVFFYVLLIIISIIKSIIQL